jgi:hypothetical protein
VGGWVGDWGMQEGVPECCASQGWVRPSYLVNRSRSGRRSRRGFWCPELQIDGDAPFHHELELVRHCKLVGRAVVHGVLHVSSCAPCTRCCREFANACARHKLTHLCLLMLVTVRPESGADTTCTAYDGNNMWALAAGAAEGAGLKLLLERDLIPPGGIRKFAHLLERTSQSGAPVRLHVVCICILSTVPAMHCSLWHVDC